METKINKTKFNKLIKKIETTLKRQTIFEPTKDEAKILINGDEEQFWWLEYEGIYIKKANAGHYIAAGKCQHCKLPDCFMLQTSGGLIPTCHSCWCKNGDD